MITVALDRYVLLGTLGKGGMGVVFEARDTRDDRIVALKILRPEVVGERGFRKRFLREARAASALDHPAIAQVYEVGQERFDTETLLALGLSPQGDRHAIELPYIVLERVEGTVLDRVIERGTTIDEVLDLMAQILAALEAAHAIGVIHRDLKPANVMVTRDGRAKLLDFGLAKILPGADGELTTGSQLTLDGMVMGTLPYLAPEQLQASDVRRRSDLFSLGVLTYELLTGQTPFPGTTMVEYARAILIGTLEPPSRLRPEIPDWLDQLLLSLLCIEPEDRPTAAEVREDLHRHHGATARPAREAAAGLDGEKGRPEAEPRGGREPVPTAPPSGVEALDSAEVEVVSGGTGLARDAAALADDARAVPGTERDAAALADDTRPDGPPAQSLRLPSSGDGGRKRQPDASRSLDGRSSADGPSSFLWRWAFWAAALLAGVIAALAAAFAGFGPF